MSKGYLVIAPLEAGSTQRDEQGQVVSAGSLGDPSQEARLEWLDSLARIATDAKVDWLAAGVEERLSIKAGAASQVAALSAQDVSSNAAAPLTVLDNLGAAIVPDLSQAERDALRRGGARIVSNRFVIRLPQTVEISQSAGPASFPSIEDARGSAYWHWHRQATNAARFHSQNILGQKYSVGILDTDVDLNHPEFADKRIKIAYFGEDGTLTDGPPSFHSVPLFARRGPKNHGTHVAAIAAGRHIGMAPEADLVIAVVLTRWLPKTRNWGGQVAQVSAGLNWLIDQRDHEPGLVAINASLGASGYLYDWYLACMRALDRGINMVSSIGNNGKSGMNMHTSPGNYDKLVGIGAVNRHGQVADFSDWGTVVQHNGLLKPDFCAPGVEILSAKAGGGYTLMSGTSMASPVVSGATTLIRQAGEAVGPLEGAAWAPYLTPPPGADANRAGQGLFKL